MQICPKWRYLYRSRTHERTISLGFPGIVISVLRLKVSVYNVIITTQCQTTFALGRGGVKSVCRGDCARRKTLKTVVPIMSKNAASVHDRLSDEREGGSGSQLRKSRNHVQIRWGQNVTQCACSMHVEVHHVGLQKIPELWAVHFQPAAVYRY